MENGKELSNLCPFQVQHDIQRIDVAVDLLAGCEWPNLDNFQFSQTRRNKMLCHVITIWARLLKLVGGVARPFLNGFQWKKIAKKNQWIKGYMSHTSNPLKTHEIPQVTCDIPYPSFPPTHLPPEFHWNWLVIGMTGFLQDSTRIPRKPHSQGDVFMNCEHECWTWTRTGEHCLIGILISHTLPHFVSQCTCHCHATQPPISLLHPTCCPPKY